MLMPAMMGRWTIPEWTHRERRALRDMPSSVARHRLSEVLRVDVRTQLADIACPVLYLQASHDRLVPPGCWREIERIASHAQRVTLQGPHFILQHQPQAAAMEVRRFVEGIAPSLR